jgi:hypothetical protein
VNTETVYSGRCEAGVVMTSVFELPTTQSQVKAIWLMISGRRELDSGELHLLGRCVHLACGLFPDGPSSVPNCEKHLSLAQLDRPATLTKKKLRRFT